MLYDFCKRYYKVVSYDSITLHSNKNDIYLKSNWNSLNKMNRIIIPLPKVKGIQYEEF